MATFSFIWFNHLKIQQYTMCILISTSLWKLLCYILYLPWFNEHQQLYYFSSHIHFKIIQCKIFHYRSTSKLSVDETQHLASFSIKAVLFYFSVNQKLGLREMIDRNKPWPWCVVEANNFLDTIHHPRLNKTRHFGDWNLCSDKSYSVWPNW